MGYAHYDLHDGREAGYAVEAECDHPACHETINRGFDYLCGEWPARTPGPYEDPGCRNYYCYTHINNHSCENPACDAQSIKGGYLCGLPKGHAGREHWDNVDDLLFTDEINWDDTNPVS